MVSEWESEEGERWAGDADRYDRMLAPFGAAVIEAADPQPGEHAIDIGCGNGALSRLVAEAVGPEGSVTGVDLSPAMLDVARQRAADAGLGHLSFVRADATTWRGDRPADVVVSRFGVMFFDDPVAAFTGIRASVRPGGRLAFACWQHVLDNPWMVVPAGAVYSVLPVPPLADPDAPGPFAFADDVRVRSILDQAGWSEVSVESARRSVLVGLDPADAMGFFRSSRMGRAAFDGADPDDAAEAERLATEVLAAHTTDRGVELDGAVWVVTARA